MSPGVRTPHLVANVEIARLFREMAELLELEGANAFRIRAYRNAARVIEEMPEPVAAMATVDPAQLRELPGIGEDLAGKIEEIARTGSLAALRQERRKVPHGASELMRVPGLGPKRARALVEQLGVRSIAGLARAAKAGRVRTLPGFGAATEQKILREIGEQLTEEHRVPRAVAAQYGEALLAYLRDVPGVSRADLAGSFRRARETVGDLDILVASRDHARVTEAFVSYPEVREVLSEGPTRSSVRLASKLQVDLRVLDEESYGAALHYFTGSKAHNIAVRRMGQQRGLKINEYGVFRGTRRIGGREEKDVFAAVGLPWIPPELRENDGEIEAAHARKLPELVTLDDIRGDLQMHTTDSDGRHTLDEMAHAAQELGYAYIAVTDHTPKVRVAGGMDRAGFRRQMKRIERLNGTLHSLRVLAGAEVDINTDGTLDLDDDTLAELDVVLVSIHSKLDLPADDQTARLVRALQHPYVDIFAHPTGRLINGRRGATFDLEQVIRVANDHGVMLEINGQPERLDLDDHAARVAVEHGAMLVISTDAHSCDELRFMRWGVDQARRGWVDAAHVANTKPRGAFVKLLHAQRR
jgi:DNA polymerase (family 10)